ncbi:AMP-binding protein [Streptomyces minutiscleroticus]|uniref:AMP-dependent synthetase/ligase domain-containing protein n=3 Tax=Streptomyces TaxID=1883 RepID=A0A918NLW1_9ACTN|nr:AMP-binding protein [Streptomyces minutiscleroticus]AGG12552.1 acyl CoA ligase [Streptomyces sp. 275]AXB74578.1 acyl CoA ligase [Streptomyces roseiscleroticus]GGX79881.1 hypothetical protein GCM10010358_37720 [Streptomyces minutiscleroticus]
MDAEPPARYATDLFTGLHRWSGRVALRTEDQCVTFDDMLARSYRIARALEDTGQTQHEGIVCLMGNSPEMVCLRLAAHLLGSRFTALHAGTPDDVAACHTVLAAARPAIFVVDRRGAQALGAPVPGMFSLGANGADHDLQALADAESAEPLAPKARERDIALVVHSRGTTGPRRGAVHRFSAMNVNWRRSDEGELGDFPAGVTTLAVSPLSGNAGEVALMLLRAGCTVRLMDDFEPGRVLATVDTERIASMYLPSPCLERLVAHGDLGHADLSSLRYLPYGNAPIAPDVLRRAIDAFGPILSQNYVTSEVRAVTLLRQEDHLAAADGRPHLLGSAGRPLPEVDIRICGPDGRERPSGETGEVWLRAPHMMSGYWREPEATEHALSKGWLRSGDIGRLDHDGYLYLSGRV